MTDKSTEDDGVEKAQGSCTSVHTVVEVVLKLTLKCTRIRLVHHRVLSLDFSRIL